jgi:atypical dual specificity phosphatase
VVPRRRPAMAAVPRLGHDHCLGGVGRTGTMVACYLVVRGATPREAIAEVRARRPGSIQTGEQERVVHRYGAETARDRVVSTDE